MAVSKRSIITILSIIYLLFLAALGAYALHLTRSHALPIPKTLSAFTLGLPFIAGLAVESLTSPNAPASSTSSSVTKYTPRFASRASTSQAALRILLVYETVLAALAGPYITPVGALRCGLDDSWLRLFRAKDGETIGRVQNAFACCGLHSVLDKAFPFPGEGRGVDACVKAYGRTKACFEEWRGEERRVGGMILGVAVGVAVWKMLILYLNSRYQNGGNGSDEQQQQQSRGRGRQIRGALEYPDTEDAPYRDDPDVENGEANPDNALIASRVQPSRLRDDSEEW